MKSTRARNQSPSRKPSPQRTCREQYTEFEKIDGTHDFKKAVPSGFIDYPARKRKGGKVGYFNFDLAREMGLISQDHPNRLTRNLEKKILETFGIVIINEYDKIHGRKFPKDEIKPNSYMATRYLQLQHKSKRGTTSGDGRSIWNGQFEKNGITWDVSSCGTGVTRLCPATSKEGKFFKTGNEDASYGCGYAEFLDGFSAALMSEIFHRNGIETERTLAVIEFSKGYSINVRAGKNLFRPSHFFLHLKQGKLEPLKASVDFFIERQIKNKDWPQLPPGKKRYEYLAQNMAETFGELSALFENEYIFCWLDWDGDNILANGGIIDYGSVRQFGLYHHEYRYDDVDRYSTTIPEQKSKAAYIVQTFAQLVDFLNTGKKKPLSRFKCDPLLSTFENSYLQSRRRHIARRIGLTPSDQKRLVEKHPKVLDEFQKLTSFFEKAKSKKGRHETEDGITWDAIFCIRDLFRELPKHFSQGTREISPKSFIHLLKSNYATEEDLSITSLRREKIRRFQAQYWKILEKVHQETGTPIQKILFEIVMRSSTINRYERITGDGILVAAEKLLKQRKSLSPSEFQFMISQFIQYNVLTPPAPKHRPKKQRSLSMKTRKTLEDLKEVIKEFREGI